MSFKLFIQAIVKFTLGAVITGTLIFLPAGGLDYPHGWLFMGLLFIPMFIAGVVLMFANPGLLEKRLNVREKEGEQKAVVLLSGIMFVAGFVLCGLNYRFGWIVLPKAVVIAASTVFVLAYLLYAEVLRENTYLSRTIEVQEGQKVVDTGLYGLVRHPMYSATLIMFYMVPLILGSVISFVVFLPYLFIIAKRIRNEEKVLLEGLEGYGEYMKKVKYRLIPYIW